ncbi:MAG TPA: hypothetical protein DCP50_00740 [Exiguobacterium sp.]|nr:hypothetical protein [Exiguobacterium sp.]
MNYNEVGFRHLEAGNYELAAQAFNDAIEQNPKDPTAYVNLGTLLQSMNDADRALRFYDRALMIHNTFASAYYAKGALFFAADQLVEAEESLRAALLYGLDDADLHFMLGMTYQKLGDPVRGLPRLQRASELNGVDIEIAFQYGLALAQNEKLEEAVEMFEHVLMLDETHTDARYNYAIALAFLGQQEACYAELEAVLAYQPEHALARDAKAKMDALLKQAD